MLRVSTKPLGYYTEARQIFTAKSNGTKDSRKFLAQAQKIQCDGIGFHD